MKIPNQDWTWLGENNMHLNTWIRILLLTELCDFTTLTVITIASNGGFGSEVIDQ